MASDVLAGAKTPVMASNWKPGTVAPTVGMPGNSADVCTVVTPKALSLPDLTWGVAVPALGNIICVCPDITSVRACTGPLYGIGVQSTPVMALNIKPESKGVRIISLRSPLYVSGTFKDPDVGVDKGAVAMKAGAAVVLGTAVAPLAALLALINPGPGEEAPCPALLAQAQKKPEAPPPEKAAAWNPGNGR